jgi:centromeric protein E
MLRAVHQIAFPLADMKQMRQKLEDEKRALVSFVSDIDNHISTAPSRFSKVIPPSRLANSVFASMGNASGAAQSRRRSMSLGGGSDDPTNSPIKVELAKFRTQPSLLEQMPEEEWEGEGDETSFRALGHKDMLGDKENMPAKI